MTSPFTLKKQITEIGRKLANRGLIAGTDGNISIRLDDDRILITPAGLAKGDLTPEDIVTVDIKRSASQDVVINAIREAQAEDVSIIITYDVDQAKTAFELAPELLLSVSARNDVEFERLLAAKIPTKNMLAFTGTRLSDVSLFERLHAEDIVCMLGTLGNLDKQAEAKGNALYSTWKDLGVDVFATDRPFEAYKAIN